MMCTKCPVQHLSDNHFRLSRTENPAQGHFLSHRRVVLKANLKDTGSLGSCIQCVETYLWGLQDGLKSRWDNVELKKSFLPCVVNTKVLPQTTQLFVSQGPKWNHTLSSNQCLRRDNIAINSLEEEEI